MRGRVLVAVAPVALLTAGCGLFGGPPDGYQEAETGVVSFVYPEEWQRAPTDDGFRVRLRRDGKTVATLSVLAKMGKASSAQLATAMGMAGPQISWRGYHVEDEHPIQVDGAREARQLTYTYRASVRVSGGQKRSVPAEGVDVAVVDDDRNATIVRITYLDGVVSHQVVSEVVNSLQVH